ncbi:6,7-dimethyl-8-ribityllumazine synthase [Cocleimonas sp. KMM 6892]|uniref:6,7-dimethyl-8-ribityllumazine synthase n=1 Tax=unclassified Cocleimonas TaxID=2639732 RepID=UPI002DBCD040|nr:MULTISPECIES: 6,7-dimethyl-8-ribityllumazine synthase [unclassified Cocleimonas]MEB8431555.1 6,7-dimethyl-8-ribityllumazine synthase [Cocleimonas sp. KMM 6892]MEC4713673.1 6,7-dimethyl-8-ribityllumazine synthase [Cocleimonas sp. KMM 6895]MEC4743004.1 6,7-dimethyl-8-ribityllumazine synthase [Cocleimonas sp. KMM 6896]
MNNLNQAKICYIQSSWHKNIVNELKNSCIDTLIEQGIVKENISEVDVPGALEIPLQAKLRAETGQYSLIIVAGLIVDGGIYRHEFVADSIIKSIMDIQLDTRIPIIHSIMTPINFHESAEHEAFFFKHFATKGKEAAEACIQTLNNCEDVKQYSHEKLKIA